MGWAEDEMVKGYYDGLDLSQPKPSGNRSRSYQHGFTNGRDDRAHKPRASAEILRLDAKAAIIADERT